MGKSPAVSSGAFLAPIPRRPWTSRARAWLRSVSQPLAQAFDAGGEPVVGSSLPVTRARFVVFVLAATCVAFFLARLVTGGVDAWSNQAVRVANFAILILLARGLRSDRPRLRPELATWIAISFSMLCSSVVCTLENDPVNAYFSAIALSVGAASFVRWSLVYQALFVAVAAVALVANQVLLGPTDIVLASGMTTTVGLALSVSLLITWSQERSHARVRVAERMRRLAEAELRRANDLLEQRVRERSDAATAAAEELRTFTASVSHDLRSPLRAINGMAQLLEEEHADKLAPSANAYLNRVKLAATRMDTLIDALLSRSRVGQAHLRRTRIDLGALADSIVSDLQGADPSRQVSWVRPDRLEAVADRRLIAVVLQHLIGNAWKFSGDRDDARVEFGSRQQAGQTEFFVRDNGAGFDMAESGKLFENFQRLHGEDYEGTGIGLATVRSIVERHGGRARIDSAPGRGTTVYFTL